MDEIVRDIKKWVVKADHDIGTAKIIFISMPKYRDIGIYHCQQAIEKYLKGFIAFHNLQFEKTHNLLLLLDIIKKSNPFLEEFRNEIRWLNTTSNHVRYPDDKDLYDSFNLERGINIAEEVRTSILAIFQLSDFNPDLAL